MSTSTPIELAAPRLVTAYKSRKGNREVFKSDYEVQHERVFAHVI